MPTLDYMVLRNLDLREKSIDVFEHVGARRRGLDEDRLDRVEIDKVELSEQERADLAKDASVSVVAAMPMQLARPLRGGNVPETGDSWGLAAIRAHESEFDGDGIVVAVLDTGIVAHPAFDGVQLVSQNFTSDVDEDVDGHGTHCAATIFGRDVGGRRIGVARGVSKALIGKVLGRQGGTTVAVIEGIQWAVANKAHLISMSLGIDFPGYVDYLINKKGFDPRPATSLALEGFRANLALFESVARLADVHGDGAVIVAAAGNESRRPQYTIAASPPAGGHREIITVGAVGHGLSVASFSNRGVDLVGPGVDVVSADSGGGLTAMSGTSMAAPHVAGAAALWAQSMRNSTGVVRASVLRTRVVGRANTSGLASGWIEGEVGTGLVQCPLE